MEAPESIPPKESKELQYAPPPAWYEHPALRRGIRWTFIVGIVLVAVLVTWATGRRAFMLHYQKQAMSFTAPPDRIAFTNDPAEAAKLLQSGSDYISGIGMSGAAMLSIPPLRRLSEIENEQYEFGYGFCHTRAAENQPQRLVKVGLPYVQGCLILEPFLRPIYQPIGSEGGPSSPQPHNRALSVLLIRSDRFRLFAGQPDPNDTAHFTFTYELNTETGTIDGWLMPDDTVKIEPRTGPLLNRSR